MSKRNSLSKSKLFHKDYCGVKLIKLTVRKMKTNHDSDVGFGRYKSVFGKPRQQTYITIR